MDIDIAENISTLMCQLNSKLNDSVAYVRDNCNSDDYQKYKKAAAKVMAAILVEIAQPIFNEHPSLLPKDLGGTKEIDPKIFEPRFYEHH